MGKLETVSRNSVELDRKKSQTNSHAQMVKLVDTQRSGRCLACELGVRVSLWAPVISYFNTPFAKIAFNR